jgi:hypothetical protein
MKTEINPFDLKKGDAVYYLGDMSASVGDKPNPTAGWGSVFDIVAGTQYCAVKIVVDMGNDYPAPGRIKTVPYYCFTPGSPLQQFKGPKQIETERQQKNDSLNTFYKTMSRTDISMASL